MAETSRQVEAGETPVPVVRTFLIADVRGYTAFTNEAGVPAAARLADRFAVLCRSTVSKHEGEVIELRGDEALAVFPTPRSAVLAAIALQARFQEEMRGDSTLPLRVGMGIDVGEVVRVQGGYRGKALNLAARLCSLAGPSDIFASDQVVTEAEQIEGLAYVERGRVQLKGFPDPIRVIHILPKEDLPENFPPLVSLIAKPSNLPLQTTPFIGREREIGEVAALLLREEVRLVTLTGAGGTGKTRLALQVGGAVLEEFERGVFFVDLAPLADSELVPSTIASTLKVREVPGQEILATLIAYLQERQLLLVLDNFEHLVPAAAVVHQLLTACSALTVLVTSRAVLHISAEHEYQVPTLAVPDPAHLPALEDLSRYEAVALFIERARAVKPAFAVSNETAPAVAEICVRLDGLPLAIELAAARIKLFPPQALFQRLSNRLMFLTGGARDRPTRQQTLRGTIDWSYSLLTAQEQTLLARLSVFAGGWTFDAAEAVCNPGGELDLLEGLASLVDKSLVRQEGVDEPRFAMLESIREYAGEKLDERREGEEIRTAHGQHFLGFAIEADDHLLGPDQVSWLDRLERDHDNLRAAVRWSINRRDAELGLRLGLNLSRFWYWRGYFRESRALCDELLALPAPPDVDTLRAGFLEGIAMVPMRQGDYPVARAYSEEAVRLARRTGDLKLLVLALGGVSYAARLQEDYAAAHAAAEEALTLAREAGDSILLARCLHLLGLVVLEGRHDLDAAWALNQQSLVLYRQSGHRRMGAVVLWTMGRAAWKRGDMVEARARFVESVTRIREVGDLGLMTQVLYSVAAVDADAGRVERAVRLQAAAAELEENMGTQVWPINRRERDDWLGLAHGVLGEASFARIWAEGRAMTAEGAISYALEESG